MGDRAFSAYMALFKLGAASGCHQMPERSFFYKNWQFPLCARCTGVFFGHVAGITLLLIGIRLAPLYAALLMLIMLADWSLQQLKCYKSNNAMRMLTGICAGLGVVNIYFHLFNLFLR